MDREEAKELSGIFSECGILYGGMGSQSASLRILSAFFHSLTYPALRPPLNIQLAILRQLVEWQLNHCEAVKSVIDEAWGVKHKITAKSKLKEIEEKENKKAAKIATGKVAPEELAGPSREDLELLPMVSQTRRFGLKLRSMCGVLTSLGIWDVQGTDASKKRYWVADGQYDLLITHQAPNVSNQS